MRFERRNRHSRTLSAWGAALLCLALSACSFDSASGIRGGENSPPDPADTGNAADAVDDGDACRSEVCRCRFRDTATGVCSEGILRSGDCEPPETWVREEGAGGGGCGDDLDNDCDGREDEGCECAPGEERDCYTGPVGTAGVGACERGTETCTEMGTWSGCAGEVVPTEESCGNGRDDDCSGTADDGEGCTCRVEGTSEGVCSEGTFDASGECTAPSAYQRDAEASCDDGRDNDCDGDTDFEDADCKKSVGQPCSVGDECISDACAILRDASTGSCAHRIFVTSTTFPPDFGSAASADTECQRIAESAGLGSQWKAVFSEENNSARDRLAIDAPIANLAGQVVAGGANDLWDRRIANSVGFDERENSRDTLVWTGSDSDGTWDGTPGEAGSPEDCDGWTSTSSDFESEVGSSTSVDDAWLEDAGPEPFGHYTCDNSAALYCIDGQ